MGRKKMVVVSITMPPETLTILDELCRLYGMTRSALIRELVLRKWNSLSLPPPLKSDGEDELEKRLVREKWCMKCLNPSLHGAY